MGLNDDENEGLDEDFEFFSFDEKILVTLTDGTHLLAEYKFESDLGLCMTVLSKTDWKPHPPMGTVIYSGRGGGDKYDPKGTPFLRELIIGVKTYMPWRRIDEIVSANEFYEEQTLKEFSKGLEHGMSIHETESEEDNGKSV